MKSLIDNDYPIDVNDLIKIRNGSFYTWGMLVFMNNIGICNDLNVSLTAMGASLVGLMAMGAIYKCHQRQVDEIMPLYYEFLNDYKKLNNNLELDNPIKISIFFQLMMENGYLSKDKFFRRINEAIIEREAYGFGVIQGKAVCRNTATMLTDVLKNMGYEAWSLSGISSETKIKCLTNEITFPFEVIDKINYYFPDCDDKGKLIFNVYKNCEGEVSSIDYRLGLARSIGHANHLITYFTNEGQPYFYDSMNRTMYVNDDIQNRVLRVVENQRFAFYIKYIHDKNPKYGEIPKIQDLSLKTPLTYAEYQNYFDIISTLFLDNLDLAEQFYKEHRDLYGEIDLKLKRANQNII